MIYLKFVILLLQVTQAIIRYADERRLIAEGERRIIADELARVAKAAKIAEGVRQDVGKKTDAQVDADLGRDFRD